MNLLRRSSVPRMIARPLRPVAAGLDRVARPFGLAEHPLSPDVRRQRAGDLVFAALIVAGALFGAVEALIYVRGHVGLGEFIHAFGLGAVTFGRVVALVAVATVIWVPVGVWIGMNPKVARVAQPIGTKHGRTRGSRTSTMWTHDCLHGRGHEVIGRCGVA